MNIDWQVALAKTHLEDFQEFINTSLVAIDTLKRFCSTWSVMVEQFDEVKYQRINELHDEALNDSKDAISIILENAMVTDYHQIITAMDIVREKHKKIHKILKDMSDISNELFNIFKKEYRNKKDNK